MHKIQGFRPLKNESPLLSPPESLYEILYFVILLYHTFIYIKNHSFVCRYYFVFHIEIHNSFIHSNHFKIVCRKPNISLKIPFNILYIVSLVTENCISVKCSIHDFLFAITAISHICVFIEMGGHRFELPKLDLRPSSTSPPTL